MPEDRDPALDPAPERGDRLFPPGTAGDGSRDAQRGRSGGNGRDDDHLFPPVAGDPERPSGSSPGSGPGTHDAADPTGHERHRDRTDAVADDGSSGADDGVRSDHAIGGGAGSTSPAGGSATPGPPARGRPKGANSFFRELPVLLLIAFVLAFVMRTFLVQVFYIPSGSMEPTLQVDDRMVVEKVTYRFREPARGEVAVFEGDSFGAPDPQATAGERFVRGVGQFLGLVPASARDFVKRVIGLPGDEILIEGGTVFVNGAPLDEPYVVFEDPSDFGPITVPDGQLFFLGDNRPNSSDSRRSLGYVDIDSVVGRAAYVIWPPDNASSLMGTEYLEPVEDP
jgi:signal peptidase I